MFSDVVVSFFFISEKTNNSIQFQSVFVLPVLDEAELPPLHVVFSSLVEPVALSHSHCFRVAEAGVLQLTATHAAFGAFKHEIQELVVSPTKPYSNKT